MNHTIDKLRDKANKSQTRLRLNQTMVFAGPDETRGDIFKFTDPIVQSALLDDRIFRNVFAVQESINAINQDILYQAFVIALDGNTKDDYREWTISFAIDKMMHGNQRVLHQTLREIVRPIATQFPFAIMDDCIAIISEDHTHWKILFKTNFFK